MIAGSDRRDSEAGSSLPREAWTIDIESSTVIDCGAGGLHVALRAAEDGQDDRLLADQEVRAVELGVQVHREVKIAHALVAAIGVGQRDREIAAEADQRLGLSRHHRLHRLDRVMAVMRRRAETERLFDIGEHHGIGLFGDADSAVALHVGMAAQRADAGAGLAEIAAHEQQGRDLLHVLRALLVLGDAHAVADDRCVRPDIGFGHPVQGAAA